ncbi:hypothetical protein [Curtobacterium sp. ISL-83]|uniref:hypothetical protein n=1 Tax=Curtobacterium sp. ISL-83 TaxID=2819145 RepID=UPI001BE5475C|nr:hypothetical protein [Curtobacterium sp. ISL-83]MBT2504123.1 hypothetical protein [Curtobacterium sp. ISL-83]
MDAPDEGTTWRALDEVAALSWVADRAVAAWRHLVPVDAVGRDADGSLVVVLSRPTGVPIDVALDRLGTPTTGVAVTLTVPLVELLVAGRSGAVLLGSAGLQDVLVDDAGAAVLCDRPPASVRVVPAHGGPPDDMPPGTQRGRSNAGSSDAGRSNPGSSAERPADHTLTTACRLVWERVDAYEACRRGVDAALAAAMDADLQAARQLLDVIRAVAPPRPVRWDPPPADFAFVEPGQRSSPTDAVDRLRDVIEHGIPIGSERRIPLRHAVVGVVIAAGLAAAGWFTLA